MNTDTTSPPPGSSPPGRLVADWQALMRTFIRPEDDVTRQSLVKYMEQILFGLHDFLRENVGITEVVSLKELADRYSDFDIPKTPEKKLAQVISDLIEDIAPHAVNVASPYFIGHMTSAIPFFMIHLKTIVAALNQNVVKIETSKAAAMVEKQVLARIHRMVFQRDDAFYKRHVQHAHSALGSFVEDGTLANISALWVARNRLLAAGNGYLGVEAAGIQEAYRERSIERCVVLVSRMAHYSLQKSGGVLGIGNRNIVPIDTDSRYRLDMRHLETILNRIHRREPETRVMAVVGIAGTTETGAVDPLKRIGALCREHDIHFHVDAAWGGPTLMSRRYREKINGIQEADSVTIDGHKQFYMPMTCGMALFRDPDAMDRIAYHARYINRPGSVDLGIKSLSGSREAVSLVLDSALKIMGSRGYELLIDHGMDVCREFADEIRRHPLFELTSEPELNILTYRLCPPEASGTAVTTSPADRNARLHALNRLNEQAQRMQRENGNSFVSRTTLAIPDSPEPGAVVFRCVLMNPLTTPDIVREILDEQAGICRRLIAEHPEFSRFACP
jgi:glutamate decarboxylase